MNVIFNYVISDIYNIVLCAGYHLACMSYCFLSHICDYILGDNLNSALVIMCFPPFSYLPRRADNRKLCNLNG